MPVDRTMWTLPFVKNRFPPWPCSKCGRGTLVLHDSMYRQEETAESINCRSDSDQEPEWIHGLFTAHLHCANPDCKEIVVPCGTYHTSESVDTESGDVEYSEVLEPKFLSPAPDIFRIPANCPEAITSEIRKAFALFWSDSNAAGNRVRAAVELLLDHLKIRRRESKKNGKYHKLTLHDRILEFHPKNPDLGEQLLAIKWLGNVGSHTTDLKKDDLIDDFEMLQFVLGELFEQTRKRLSTMARKIIRKKGPTRK